MAPSDDVPPRQPLARPVRLAVLISGSGTTLQNLLDEMRAGRLDGEVTCVLSSRAGVAGIERAARAGLPVRTVARADYADSASFNDAIHSELAAFEFDLVILAGFLSLFEPRAAYRNRVLNIHPALIPSFCGAGYYGARVHQAVLDSGVKITGCTVHFADDEYDHGPIILQEAVPVEDDDTVDSLARRIHAAENRAYPEAIRLWAAGRLEIAGRRVRIRRR